MKVFGNVLFIVALATFLTAEVAHAQLLRNSLRGRLATSAARSSRDAEPIAQRGGRTNPPSSPKSGNNRILPRHDLAITGLTGADDALMTTVQNQGFTRSPASRLKIVVKDRVSGRIRTTKTARVAPIEPNRVARVRVHSLPLGNSVVFVTVDPDGQIIEANEQNNRQSITFGTPTVPSDPNQRPDLLISGLQAQGNVLLVQVTNVGRSRSGAAPVNIVIRGRDGRLQDTKSGRIQALNPNQIGRIHIRNVVLDDVTVTATVDPVNRIAERREDNNTRQVTIASQTRVAPDLTITDIMFKRDQKEVWFAVRNVGPVAQQQDVSLTVKSYFGPGNLVERSALRVSRVNAGQTIWHRWSVERLNSGMQFEGVLDVSNRLPEQNERNNRRIESFD